MTRTKRTQTPGYLWEQALIDAYADFRWQQVLDPLYQKLQQWKAGELGHWEISEAIHLVHKKTQQEYNFFTQNRSWLVRVIQFDQDWYQPWLKENPPPPGYDIDTFSRP